MQTKHAIQHNVIDSHIQGQSELSPESERNIENENTCCVVDERGCACDPNSCFRVSFRSTSDTVLASREILIRLIKNPLIRSRGSRDWTLEKKIGIIPSMITSLEIKICHSHGYSTWRQVPSLLSYFQGVIRFRYCGYLLSDKESWLTVLNIYRVSMKRLLDDLSTSLHSSSRVYTRCCEFLLLRYLKWFSLGP